MCMCAESFSWLRKLASVALSLSRCETAMNGPLPGVESPPSLASRHRSRRDFFVNGGALSDDVYQRLDARQRRLDARDHRVQRLTRGLHAVAGARQRAADLLRLLERGKRLVGGVAHARRVHGEIALGGHQAATARVAVGKLE